MHDERVRGVQEDVVAVTRIKGHQCFATIKLLRPSREEIPKLEERVVGNGYRDSAIELPLRILAARDRETHAVKMLAG